MLGRPPPPPPLVNMCLLPSPDCCRCAASTLQITTRGTPGASVHLLQCGRRRQARSGYSLSTASGATRMTRLEEYFGPNAGYVADLFDQYQQDPASVDAETRAIFDAWQRTASSRSSPAPAPTTNVLDVSAAAGAAALAQGIRLFGHRGASLDPLGSDPPGDPQLDAANYGVDDDLLERLPGRSVGGPIGRTARNAAVAIRQLRAL